MANARWETDPRAKNGGFWVETSERPVNAKRAKKRKRVTALQNGWMQMWREDIIRITQLTRSARPIIILMVLSFLVHEAKSNRVILTNDLLKMHGVDRQMKRQALRILETIGVISIERSDRTAPIIIHNWYAVDGKWIAKRDAVCTG
jgi:hypothetical protein